MRARLIAPLTAFAVAATGTVAVAGQAPNRPAVEPVVAQVSAAAASLNNGVISRTWALAAGAVTTTALIGGSGSWAAAGPDFAVNVDGVNTSSTTGWVLSSVTAQAPPAQPDRPTSSLGRALLFRYDLVSAAIDAVGVELDRLVVLHPGSAVIETTSTLIDHGPMPLRISSYSLDQITAADLTLPAEVQAYNGGSDWRDDFRHVSDPAGAFDAEGEVVRFGADSGFFLVSQRRGGSMSRVGRDATGRSYVGVDWARDAFDFGPLQSSPPDYNRLDNPAYPVPVRSRLVQPLGSLALGTAYLGVYAGGAQQAAANFTTDFYGSGAPAFDRSVDLNTFHPWGHGDGMSDVNLRKQVDAAKALGIETFMLDDQWQGGTDGESGDWNFDPARFPDSNGDGVPDFVDYLHSQGLQLGLWMSPLEFNSASQTYAAHPDWACTPTGDATAQDPDDAGLGVWDATNPAFQDYLVSVVDRLVRVDDVREFKFDFMAWVDCGTHDYADYEDAFVALVHRLEVAHPDVTFELDETNDQRAYPFESAAIGPSWFDNDHTHGSTVMAKLIHDVWSASPWVPTWSLGLAVDDGTLTGAYDGVAGVDVTMALAILTHPTFWTDLTTLTPAEQAETRWWISWYRAHHNQIGPAIYELTNTDPLDGMAWAAWQSSSGNSGYVVAIRQGGGPDTLSVALHDLTAGAHYAVRDVRSGRNLGTFTAAVLSAGLPLTLATNTAEVLSVTRS